MKYPAARTYVQVPDNWENPSFHIIVWQGDTRHNRMVVSYHDWKSIGSPRHMRVTIEPLTQHEYEQETQ